MIKFLFLLILVVSCATGSQKKDWKSLGEKPNYHEKLIPVSSKDEARKVINNRVNFIKMIFEQTIDPYFGTPRWSEYCLKVNHIGDVTESAHGIQSISHLFLNPQGEPGFCNDNTDQLRSHLVFVYCEGMKNVMEIKYSQADDVESPQGELCK